MDFGEEMNGEVNKNGADARGRGAFTTLLSDEATENIKLAQSPLGKLGSFARRAGLELITK